MCLEIVTIIILLVTMFIMIISFNAAYRPSVSVTEAISKYDKNKKELQIETLNRNSGNVPASNTDFKIKLFEDDVEVVLKKNTFNKTQVVFPGQITTGSSKFIDVTPNKLKTIKYTITFEIKYEHLILKYFKRSFMTFQKLQYSYINKNFSYIEGYTTKKLLFH